MSNDIVAMVDNDLQHRLKEWEKYKVFTGDLLEKRRSFLFFAQAALAKDENLQQCEKLSLVEAITRAATMGLPVNDGSDFAHLIAYGKRAKLVIGYRGLMKLAMDRGGVSRIWAREVYDGDDFSYEYGLDETLTHRPDVAAGTRRPLTHVYACCSYTDGERQFEVMSKDQVDDIRKRAPGSNSGPWSTDYTAMAKKTVIRRLCNYIIASTGSTALAMAVAHDEAQEYGLDESEIIEVEEEVEE